MNLSFWRKIALLCSLSAAGILALLSAALLHLDGLAKRPLPIPPGTSVIVKILAGSSARAIAGIAQSHGLVSHPLEFLALARFLSLDSRLQAGHYRLAAPMSLQALLAKISRGDVATSSFSFPEGWTLRQIRAAMEAHPDLPHDSRTMSDAELLAAIGAEEANLEGLLAPDTYAFRLGDSDIDLYRRAYRTQKERIAKIWADRADGLPYSTPYEALILASIVEKETGDPAERPLIASAFSNRLRLGMRLQTDPTVIYGLGERFDGNLRKADLLADTPHNTYTRAGLPPTPIASPGLAALRAAAQPLESEFIYFVASGHGRHQFSATLEEHNLAVDMYQRGILAP